MNYPTRWDHKINSFRGRKLSEIETGKLITIAITLNHYAQQPWYKKIRRIK